MMSPVDIEALPLGRIWSRSFADRVFAYDAFLSHRWKSADAMAFKRALDDTGVLAWHDETKDLRDRQAEGRVSRALFYSRFVVVCLDASFRYSPWIRAEVLNALQAERQASATRVLIAELSPGCLIPDEIAAVTKFICHDGHRFDPSSIGFRQIAKYLREGNLLPFNADEVTAASLLSQHESEQIAHEAREILAANVDRIDTEFKAFLNGREASAELFDEFDTSLPRSDMWHTVRNGLARLIIEKHDKEGGNPPQLFMALRGYLHDNHQGILDNQLLRMFALRTAIYFGQNGDMDDRANAIMILLCLANHSLEPDKEPINSLLRFLQYENDEVILEIANEWIIQYWPEASSNERMILLRAALPAIPAFRPGFLLRIPEETAHAFFAALPEAFRVRSFLGRCLDTDILSTEERRWLIFQRVQFISQKSRKESWLSGPELEIEFRSLSKLLFSRHFAPGLTYDSIAEDISGVTPDDYDYYVRICRYVVAVSERRAGNPLIGLQDYFLDYFLAPLLRLIEFGEPEQSRAAKLVYLRACRVWNLWSESHRHEAQFYVDCLRGSFSGENRQKRLIAFMRLAAETRQEKVRKVLGIRKDIPTDVAESGDLPKVRRRTAWPFVKVKTRTK